MALNAEMSSVELIGNKAMDTQRLGEGHSRDSEGEDPEPRDRRSAQERIVAVKPVLAKIGPMYKADGKELVD